MTHWDDGKRPSRAEIQSIWEAFLEHPETKRLRAAMLANETAAGRDARYKREAARERELEAERIAADRPKTSQG